MKVQTLEVSVANKPFPDAQGWFDAARLLPKNINENKTLKTKGILCPLALEVLKNAFKAGLPRFVGWDLGKVPDENREVFVGAARVYKRGVRVREIPDTPSRLGMTPPPGNAATPFRTETTVVEFGHSVESAMQSSNPEDAFVVIDANVAELWKFPTPTNGIVCRFGETTKTLESVRTILDTWDQASKRRPFVIVGGGLLGDVAGFAASLCQQAFVYVPTTLLAMVDASIGGKTGVNFPPYGKNQVGVFANPSKVIISSEWLETLPERERRAGFAECLKHGFLSEDEGLMGRLMGYPSAQDDGDGLAAQDGGLAALNDGLLRELVEVKARVVMKDPYESGPRKSLNLGHTLAHALEAISHSTNHTIHHGEAVALGLCFCFFVSRELELISEGELDRWLTWMRRSRCLVAKADLRFFLGNGDLMAPILFEAIHQNMSHDKKNYATSDEIQMTLLTGMGKVHNAEQGYTTSVNAEVLKASWRRLVDFLH
ncbi:MAG: 3-dehydroquinate synthase family protein [Oligoflexales bacterium]